MKKLISRFDLLESISDIALAFGMVSKCYILAKIAVIVLILLIAIKAIEEIRDYSTSLEFEHFNKEVSHKYQIGLNRESVIISSIMEFGLHIIHSLIWIAVLNLILKALA
jgi:hypothetical protein